MLRSLLSAGLVLVSLTGRALADGPADNLPEKVRRIPKLGLELSTEQRTPLAEGLAALEAQIAELAKRDDRQVADLLPDVRIYAKAVRDALEHQEFFDAQELSVAARLLEEGRRRAADLAEGRAPWTTATGLVVRGYTSRIDGSVQPYGLVVPESYDPRGLVRHRLDIWFHGRGETLSEVNFIENRQRQKGEFAPRDSFVLHPYGRYCNAFKFAGEVDVLEALESARQRYRIDEDLISVRGFSMGGAACWHFAVHYADRWFAANPGAGFAETPEFLRIFQKESTTPTWYERRLWHLYDATDWAPNLFHCPTVAYSGENDSQKQAADIMAEALDEAGLKLRHLIGPKTGHQYHPESHAAVERIMDGLAEIGRERYPDTVHLVTYTLKYNRLGWVTIDGMQEHWERAAVAATFTDASTLEISTDNVTDLTLELPPGWCPLDADEPVFAVIDHHEVQLPQPLTDRSWRAQLHLDDGKWEAGPRPPKGLRKRHDLQGPIDDAFMDSFIFVRPSGEPRQAAVGKWAAGELDRAIEHWRRQFRGDARVRADDDISDEDIASSNLVLWGDPSSNRLLARIAPDLPIRWTDDAIVVGEREFPAQGHALVLIYPNPLNPNRYVVLNSGFTYRDYAYLNNARQVPMLPDWAVVDLSTPPNAVWPGKIAAAGFFDEQWRLQPDKE
jgi:pimeloyl-ACP methyl ester carboxylesterase